MLKYKGDNIAFGGVFVSLDAENWIYFYFTKRYSLRKGSPMLVTSNLQHQANVIKQQLPKLQKLQMLQNIKLEKDVMCRGHNTGI